MHGSMNKSDKQWNCLTIITNAALLFSLSRLHLIISHGFIQPPVPMVWSSLCLTCKHFHFTISCHDFLCWDIYFESNLTNLTKCRHADEHHPQVRRVTVSGAACNLSLSELLCVCLISLFVMYLPFHAGILFLNKLKIMPISVPG